MDLRRNRCRRTDLVSRVYIWSLLLSPSRGGSCASRFGFSRLFELSTPFFSSLSRNFLCVVSGVHSTGPRCSFGCSISRIRPCFRAARGTKAEAAVKSYSRLKRQRFVKQQLQLTSRSGLPGSKVLYATTSPNNAPVAYEPRPRSLSSCGSSVRR